MQKSARAFYCTQAASFALQIPLTCSCSDVTDALEHAAWTKGSRHMQPLRDDLNWFQHSSLDVMLFLGSIVTAVLALAALAAIFIGRAIVRVMRRQGFLTHAKSS